MERLLLKYSLWVLIVSVEIKAYRACFAKERTGLLEIKASILTSNCEIQDNLDSWVDDGVSNCCDWDRITCDATSKRVIAISLNYTTGYPLNFTGIVCSFNLSLLHSFGELLHLDLSHNRFNGWTNHGGFEKLSGLKKLQILDVSSNYFNKSILSSVRALVSLKNLILRSNDMAGLFPSNELGDLIKLEVLDLSHNFFNGTLSWEGLCGLKSLLELGLSVNQFSGPLPQCLSNLTNLQVLDLTSNEFSGNIQSVVSKLTSLKYLFLSGNKFEGLFSFSSLANHKKLEIFELSSGSTMLELETEIPVWFPTFQLKVIDLPNCNLNLRTRRIPSFLLYQHDLQFIDLSHNNLIGAFPSWILQNNSRLEVMNMMNNSFTGTFQLPSYRHELINLKISSNSIAGQIPKDIGLLLSNLRYLNMSWNCFEGNIPSSISQMEGLSILDLSNNYFSGELPRSLLSNSTYLVALVLSNNNFQGRIFPETMNLEELTVLDMNNNNFSGKIDVDFFYCPRLSVLDISKNKVAGVIPIQLCNLSSVEILDLSENRFFGAMPSCFNASSLRYLFLQKNGLNGLIPHVLSRSSNLVVVDLRNNKFSGNIPSWISQLSELHVLLLGGNALGGHIPNQLCQLRNLKIMDLSHNLLCGSIPSCFHNISFGSMVEESFSSSSIGVAMASHYDSYAYYKATLELDLPGLLSWSSSSEVQVEFIMKYRYNSYKGSVINLMAGIDLSRNELRGEIPSEIGDIQEIRSLNLSYNHLSGSIPFSFSNLKNLESLDLRNNSLSGEIPTQLVELNFLGTFDVSYNNLSGRILEKGQFGTFDESSYKGNPELCGDLIHRSCNTEATTPPSPSPDVDEEDEGPIDMFWFYWSFCASYVTILLGIVAILYINRYWRILWFNYIDVCIYSISIRIFGTVPY
eukprot:XP_015573815.1 receptor-like protein 9a isoform X1 [Ricinus communis]